MASAFDSQVDQMHKSSQHVEEVNQNIQSMMKSLEGEIGTVQSHFHGAASQTFIQLMDRYNQDVTKLNSALRGIAEQIQEAARGYQTTDESSSQALRGAGSGLNA